MMLIKIFIIMLIFHFFRAPDTITTEEDFTHSGLLIVFKSMFKFMETAWEDGQKNEFCTELLKEMLNMFQSIQKPILYNDIKEEKPSKVLLGFLEYSVSFLSDIVSRYFTFLFHF
jgi:hypothetical protein